MHFLRKLSFVVIILSLSSITSFVQAQEIERVSKVESTYTVQIGDTLTQIAKEYDRDVDYLLKLNGIDNQNHINVGQTLELGDGETLSDGKVYVKLYPAYIAGLAKFKYTAATPASTGGVQPATLTQVGGVLSNGNTAGEIGAYAAKKMEEATGVPASTWEYIIARESNGQADIQNASGAAGLFQTMPGWGSTATVDDQINAALNAYNAQGLSAWGY